MSLEELQGQKEQEIRQRFEEFVPQAQARTDGMYSLFKAGFKANAEPTGNQYSGYLKENNITWAKIHHNEPVFILRGQDNTAPEIILKWIAKNLDTVEEGKIKEAFQTVLAMRRYDKRRDPT